MKKLIFHVLLVNLILSLKSEDLELDELDNLLQHLNKDLTNIYKIGFLSASNYNSIKRILPENVRAVIIEHKEDLTKMVLNESLIAALVSGMPEAKYHDSLHIFSSNQVTLHSILMAPDVSKEQPHGVPPTRSTVHLSQAINAAIARLQLNGDDLKIALKNSPKEITQAHTCKDDELGQFEVPSRKDAEGLLKDVLDNNVIKVLANGPYNWGDNDGNYLLDPPIGFYPDILKAIIDQFQNLSGPDNVKYGKVKIERVYTKDNTFPWFKLFDGSAHISEPYFILDAAYSGSGLSCSSDSDCFNSSYTPSGRETCALNHCTHPARPRVFMFRASCTVVGSDSKFFTKRKSDNRNPSSGGTNAFEIVMIVILTLTTLTALAGLGFLVFKERQGMPIFKRL